MPLSPRRRSFWSLALCLALFYTLLFLGALVLIPAPAFAQTTDPRVRAGLVSPEVIAGARLFFVETFQGNGRTCGTCHPALGDLTVSPAEAQAIYNRSNGQDLLFAPAVPRLEIPLAIRLRGLILENLDGFADPANRFVLRAIPHTLSLATSIDAPANRPGDATGWGGDGAPPPRQLRDFATGAVTQHFPKTIARRVGIDFRLPTDAELAAFDTYMRSVGRLNEIDLAALRFTDAAAARGRDLFRGAGRCDGCHRDAGARASFSGRNESFATGVQLALSLPGAPADDGFGTPGDGTFNTPPLIEAADTMPAFHTHGAATIEDAVRFYTTPAFAGSPAGAFLASQGTPVTLTEPQVQDVAALLRVLNAGLNLRMAAQRWEAVGRIDTDPTAAARLVSRRLLQAGGAEVADALRVLGDRGLGRAAAYSAGQAIGAAILADGLPVGSLRAAHLGRALQLLDQAEAALVRGLRLELGPGNLAIPVRP